MRFFRWQIVGLSLVAIVGAGYLSALISRNACENRVARDIARLAGQQDVHVLPDFASESSRILSRAQLRVSPCDPAGPGSACAPLAIVDRGGVVAPYVVSLRWAFNKNGLNMGGFGSRRRFLCIFGLIFELPEADRVIGLAAS
jgi:hypothetical protein